MTRLIAFFAVLLLAAPAWSAEPQLKSKDLKVGGGDEVVTFAQVSVHYTGWLLDGTKFDSSRDRGKPFTFTVDAGEVIPGWDLGVRGMRVGGVRELIIPPEMAYGQRGVPGAIPGNATLKFEVEVLGLTPPPFTNVDNGALKALIERGVPVVDIRRPDEWQQTGVIEGSKLIMAIDGQGKFQRAFVNEFTGMFGENDEVVVICRTGNRSAAVSKYLADFRGYTKIYNVTDGITKWIGEGKPVAKP